jgi:hypothetical protein
MINDLINTVAAYRLAANRHRPTDARSIAAAARVLQSQGLRVRDISQALGLQPDAVVLALRAK